MSDYAQVERQRNNVTGKVRWLVWTSTFGDSYRPVGRYRTEKRARKIARRLNAKHAGSWTEDTDE